MPAAVAARIDCREVWIQHEQGRLFARLWTPEESGDSGAPATPIVLFHDSLGCVELWRDFPALLSEATGRQVIAYDRLGFGRSDSRKGIPDLDFVADEARRYFPVLLDQLGLQRFIALGHSVGGGMAVNCAAAYAGRCEALITIAAQVYAEDRTLESIAVAKEQFKDPQQLERLEKYHGSKAKWVLDAWTETWLDPGFTAWSLEPVLPRVTCPVLGIHGAYDEYGTTRHPELITQLSAGPAQREIMADTYHVPHRERPAEVLALVRGFLSAIDAPCDQNILQQAGAG